MPDAFLAGTSGYVKLGATAYAFGKWTGTFETNLPNVNNYTGGGYQQLVKGITKGTIKLSGPYNLGNMPLVSGNEYEFHLGLTATPVELVVTALVSKLELESDIDGRVSINVEAQSNGAFTAAVT